MSHMPAHRPGCTNSLSNYSLQSRVRQIYCYEPLVNFMSERGVCPFVFLFLSLRQAEGTRRTTAAGIGRNSWAPGSCAYFGMPVSFAYPVCMYAGASAIFMPACDVLVRGRSHHRSTVSEPGREVGPSAWGMPGILPGRLKVRYLAP